MNELTSDKIDFLKKWMYINSVCNDKLLQVWEIILRYNKKPVIFTRKWEVLHWFYKLTQDQIKEEDFFLFNDISFDKGSYNYIVTDILDIIWYIKNIWKKNNEIFVIDDLFEGLIPTNENIYFV